MYLLFQIVIFVVTYLSLKIIFILLKSLHVLVKSTAEPEFSFFLCLLLNSGPNFELMASAHLSLDDVGDSVHTHDLQLENVGE